MKVLLLLLLTLALWASNTAQLKTDLIEMEGYSNIVYRDSTGNLTAGIGHRLTKKDLKLFQKGTKVTTYQINKWFNTDIQWALRSAAKASKRMQVDNIAFIHALTQMYFQLGNTGASKFIAFEHHIKHGNYIEAKLALYDSKWNEQTPRRVEVVVRTIEALRWQYGA